MGKGMKAGKKPKTNQASQMMQIQALQGKMQAAQEEIENTNFEATAGGGAVKVVLNGKHEMISVTIDPDVAKDDIEMLQDLIIAATNEAERQISETTENKMGALTGGMGFGF